jgi:ferredoxin
MEVAMDVARSVLRLGVKEVHMVCLESRAEMPAHDWEIEEAIREGVTLHTSLGPKRILGKEGKVKGLETIRVASVFDSQGKFNPTFIEGTESIMGADSIVLAIGQAPDLSFLKENDNVQITSKGTILIETETLATTAPGIFAGGDVAFGPRLLIDAIADGKKAARSIDEYLKAGAGGGLQRGIMVPVDEIYEDFDKVKRQEPPTIPLDRRMGIDEVELGFPLEIAKKEGERCLKCHLNTIFDSEKCILCGGCVDVCPFYCLKMVKIGEIEGEEELTKLVEARYSTPLDRFQKGTEELKLLEEGTAMIKDETLCIRCGLCVEYCPTGAITLEALQMEEIEEGDSGN